MPLSLRLSLHYLLLMLPPMISIFRLRHFRRHFRHYADIAAYSPLITPLILRYLRF